MRIRRNLLPFWPAIFAGALILSTAAHAQTVPRTPPARTPPATPATPAAVAKAAIDVTEAWTRATPGRATSAAVYFRIVNAGKDSDTLTGVDSPNAQRAMVHVTTTANGTSTMNMMPSLPVPPSSTVTLAPGGRHVMLEGLKAPLREGESFIITFTFAKAGKVSTTVKVLGVAAAGPAAR